MYPVAVSVLIALLALTSLAFLLVVYFGLRKKGIFVQDSFRVGTLQFLLVQGSVIALSIFVFNGDIELVTQRRDWLSALSSVLLSFSDWLLFPTIGVIEVLLCILSLWYLSKRYSGVGSLLSWVFGNTWFPLLYFGFRVMLMSGQAIALSGSSVPPTNETMQAIEALRADLALLLVRLVDNAITIVLLLILGAVIWLVLAGKSSKWIILIAVPIYVLVRLPASGDIFPKLSPWGQVAISAAMVIVIASLTWIWFRRRLTSELLVEEQWCLEVTANLGDRKLSKS